MDELTSFSVPVKPILMSNMVPLVLVPGFIVVVLVLERTQKKISVNSPIRKISLK